MIAIAIILNGISRKKQKFYSEIHPALSKKFSVEVFETQWAGHASELASQATQRRFDFILAAGGDGTLHQVVNGVMQNEKKLSLPGIGLIPLGTGNDFARMCHLKANALQLIGLLEAAQPRPTDIGKIICRDPAGGKIARYFINVCSLGMGPEVVRKLATSIRALGPSLTYFLAILNTFLTHRPQEVFCQTPAWKWQGKARVLAVANGQSFGHSLYVAPDAAPGDGVFNSFIAGELPLWRFLLYLQTIKSKNKIRNEQVMYNTMSRAELSSPEPCGIESDGEWVGQLPAEIELLPGRINFFR